VEENSRLVETAPIDLEVNGSAIRVVCSDPGGAEILRQALAAHIVARDTPLGFVLNAPSKKGKLTTLTDRCGFVLARTRALEQALAVLGGHLSALLSPVPGTIRLKMRAVASPDGAVALAAFPLFAAPPVTERRLERTGWRIVDRLVVDVRVDAGARAQLQLVDVPWPALATLDPGPGHARPATQPSVLGALLLPALPGEPPPSEAAVVHALATAAVGSASLEASMAAAEALARAVPHVAVSLDEPNVLYDALTKLDR
jgi:hypothetical protein